LSPVEQPPAEAIPPSEALARDFSFRFFAWVVTALVTAMLGFMVLGGRFADVYMFLAGSEEVSGDVVLVSVGPESLYIWNPEEPAPELTPRAMLAEIVRVLDAHGAQVIALDVLLEGRRAGDEALALAARSHGAVIGGSQFVEVPGFGEDFAGGISPALADPFFAVDASRVQSAHVNLFKEEPRHFSNTMVVRGVRPVVRTSWRAPLADDWRARANLLLGAKTSVSLGLAGAWLYRARQSDPAASLESLIEYLDEVCPYDGPACDETGVSGLPALGTSLFEPFSLNFLGSEESNRFDVVQARDLLTLAAGAPPLVPNSGDVFEPTEVPEAGEEVAGAEAVEPLGSVEADMGVLVDAKLAGRLEGKLVVVGRTDRMAIDRHSTPYAFPLFTRHDMAGVLIQAQTMEAILTGRKIRAMGWWTLLLTFLAVAGAGAVYRYLGAGRQFLVWGLSALGSLGVGHLLFSSFDGLVLELGGPVTASLLTLASCHLMAYAKGGRGAAAGPKAEPVQTPLEQVVEQTPPEQVVEQTPLAAMVEQAPPEQVVEQTPLAAMVEETSPEEPAIR